MVLSITVFAKCKKQLKSLDSLYIDFVSAADLRYKTGETNLLEKATAETKRGQLSLIIKQNETEAIMAYASLKTLLNTSEDFAIRANDNYQPLILNISFDISLIANNPSLLVLYQQALIAEQNRKVEISSTFPDLNVGYFNQSLIGTQTVNGMEVYYDGSKRFQGFNVGVGIPLTF